MPRPFEGDLDPLAGKVALRVHPPSANVGAEPRANP